MSAMINSVFKLKNIAKIRILKGSTKLCTMLYIIAPTAELIEYPNIDISGTNNSKKKSQTEKSN